MAEKKAQAIIIKKKKGGGGHGHHGGAWKVAYADFVTAMMAFFLVMWLMGSDEEIKPSVEEFFMNPNSEYKVDPSKQLEKNLGGNSGDGSSIMRGMNGGLPDSAVRLPSVPFAKEDKPVPDYLQSLEDLKQALTTVDSLRLEELKMTVPEKMLFESGSADFRLEAYEYLTTLGKFVGKFGGRMKVEGYTLPLPKNVPASVDLYEFAMTRAVSVMAFMVRNRVMDEERVSPKVYSGAPPGATASDAGRALAGESTGDSTDRLLRFSFNR